LTLQLRELKDSVIEKNHYKN